MPAGVQRDARAQRAQADLALQVVRRGAGRGGVAAGGRALRASHSCSALRTLVATLLHMLMMREDTFSHVLYEVEVSSWTVGQEFRHTMEWDRAHPQLPPSSTC